MTTLPLPRSTSSPLRQSRTVATSLGALGTLAVLGLMASSHREAPAITERPKVDATDFYMFTSYEPGREDFVTLIANYQPLQDPYGGPNYFVMDSDAVYDIRIDNDGDAHEDLVFRFRFQSTRRDIALSVGDPGQEKEIAVPLRSVAPISSADESALNELESYTVELLRFGQGAPSTPIIDAITGEARFSKPLDNVGTKSIPDYAAYAASKVYEIRLPHGHVGRMFVGQRKDPFVVNLGETFDLVNLNPLGPVDGRADSLADKNVTSLVLEVPKAFLTAHGHDVIGGWTTASIARGKAPHHGKGANLSQVSRLGSPLVNEVVIGLKDKDRFNASRPMDDAHFADYVTHPVLPELLESLFGVTAPNEFPRGDLVQVFVTGVPGLTENGSFGEMLRLNTAIAPTPAALQSELGVLAGDLAGFPNGRRPGDDVVDMALRVMMGVLLPLSAAPDGQLPYTDGAFVDASAFDDAFPYLRDPIPGAPQ